MNSLEQSGQTVEPTEELPEPAEMRAELRHQVDEMKGSQEPETLSVESYLSSFENDINESSITSIEKRSDDAVVIHCKNLFEYLKFGYQEDAKQVAQIRKHQSIFEALSSTETLAQGMRQLQQLPEDERTWIVDKLNAEGSAVPVAFKDGKRRSIVMMNDAPTKRLYNADGSLKSPAQLDKYDQAYKLTVEHEVKHTQFYNKYGRDLEEWKNQIEKLRPLKPSELRKYHYDRYMKDEIVAHMENEVIEQNGQYEINWDGIVANLQKADYCFPDVFESQEDKHEYLSVLKSLVTLAKEEFNKGTPKSVIMDKIATLDVSKLM